MGHTPTHTQPCDVDGKCCPASRRDEAQSAFLAPQDKSEVMKLILFVIVAVGKASSQSNASDVATANSTTSTTATTTTTKLPTTAKTVEAAVASNASSSDPNSLTTDPAKKTATNATTTLTTTTASTTTLPPARPQHLVVSGTGNIQRGTQDFDGVYKLVENQAELYGDKVNGQCT